MLFVKGTEWLKERYENVHEEINHMDLFAHTDNSDCCEIEIKMADYDLYKEKGKESKIFKHSNYKDNTTFCPNHFYFLVPSNLVKKCIKFCNTYFPNYGVLEFDGTEIIVQVKAKRLSRKIFKGEFLDYQGRKEYKHNRYLKV